MKFCLFCNQPLKYSPEQRKLMLERRCPHCRTSFPDRGRMVNPDYFRYTSPEAAERRRRARKSRAYDDLDAFGKANRYGDGD